MKHRALLLFALSLTVLLAASWPGCVHSELDSVREVRMATHVDDWRDQVIYQLLTDRFANGDASTDHRIVPGVMGRYQGGDWQGIIDHLDYLEELGVTALWISPIVLNVDYDAGYDAYHGYWAVDFYRLNPHFGDLAALRRLVDEVHARGMLVIVDIVTNHLGQVFYYDINGNGQPDETLIGSGSRSPLTRINEYDPDYDPRGIQGYTSLGESGPSEIRFFDMPGIFRVQPNPPIFREPWAYNRRGRVTDYGISEQVIYGDFPGGLKDVNTEDPRVREAMVEIYTHWVLETDIDGYRIDTLKHVENGFWEYFAPEIRRRVAEAGKTNFLMFGEAFDGNDALLGSFTQPNRLDSVFYFSQKYQVFQDVFQLGGPTRQIERLHALRDTNYSSTPQPDGVPVPPRDLLVNFLDNHDVPRFLYGVSGTGEASTVPQLHAALAYLMTEDGIPCLYYGTEQQFSGGNDPQNREPLWWSGYATDGETFQWFSRLSTIRRGYRALTRGTFTLRWVTDHVGAESDAGIVAFERVTAEGEYALVVINTQDKDSETAFEGTQMMTTAAAGTELVDVLAPETRLVVGAGGALTVPVGPYGAAILVPADQFQPDL